ncbi:MAG: MFS transporter [Alphaproteobacteria bacterium]|nr:MFS transporter [Alphaproteobacteria bacterium]
MGSRTGSMFALASVVLIGMTGFGVFLPIFPFLSLELGATPTATTIAMGAYSLGQLIASPLWGRLSDRIGRKPILIIGLLGGVISYLWIAHAHTIYDLGAARMFGGLMAGNVGAAFAAAADLADDKTRARNMGMLGAAVGLGFIGGPALGALLIGQAPERESFVLVCYMSAALAGLAALAALVLFRESLTADARLKTGQQRPRRLAMLASRPALTRFIVVMFLAIAAQALMETTFGLWADKELQWGPREVGWTLAALGAGAVVLQGGGAGRAARVLGERMMLLIGLVLFAAGFAGLAVSHEVPTMAASLTALVIGIGLSTPALNALIAAQAAENERGAVMGLSQSASALGRVAGPLGAGALFDQLGSGAPFAVAAVLIIGALFVALGEPAKEVVGGTP